MLTPEPPLPRARIMVVDDNPANLKLLEAFLWSAHYEVQSFPLGRMALAAADIEAPDLILLDVEMPEMDGYAVCERLKSSERLSAIPVIFISARDTNEDKIKGFRAGGADYVSKPFQFEEVQARVETHLKLHRALKGERDVLERTLAGAIAALLELLQLTSPVLVLRSNCIREIVLWITKRMGLKDAWQYEIAAMLCLVGCISLPDELFDRAYGGQQLSPAEEQIFRLHPEVGARLVTRIPRLEAVGEMIRMQRAPGTDVHTTEQSVQGAQMLHLASELDRRIYLALERERRLLYRETAVCSEIANLRSSGRFNGAMLDALDSYRPLINEFEVRQLLIREIRSGMVLDEDLWSADGKLGIFKKGAVLTPIWIDHLANFAKSRGMKERVRVQVPRLASAFSWTGIDRRTA
jgi:response regulator RpfG family c-di-GMP phosphodiesterase